MADQCSRDAMTHPPKRILFVCGTRPEAIKLGPVYMVMRRRRRDFAIRLCLSGQHDEMVRPFLAVFEMRPHDRVNLMRRNQDLGDFTARAMVGLGRVMDRWRPDWVIGQGDTTTAFCAALVAFYRRIPFAHVEAGLRTYDLSRPYPEEANRRMIACLATLHFAPTQEAGTNLLREGVPETHVIVTGNTIVDALRMMTARKAATPRKIVKWATKTLEDRRMVLVTAHRREHYGTGLVEICRAIRSLSARFCDVEWVWPVHLNPNVSRPIYRELSGLSNVHLLKPAAYGEFLWLLRRSCLVLTDSGGVQEEAPSFGRPVVVMRSTTERPEGVKAGMALLVGADHDEIVAATGRLIGDPAAYSRMIGRRNPYGDGRAAQRIADVLAKRGTGGRS